MEEVQARAQRDQAARNTEKDLYTQFLLTAKQKTLILVYCPLNVIWIVCLQIGHSILAFGFKNSGHHKLTVSSDNLDSEELTLIQVDPVLQSIRDVTVPWLLRRSHDQPPVLFLRVSNKTRIEV